MIFLKVLLSRSRGSRVIVRPHNIVARCGRASSRTAAMLLACRVEMAAAADGQFDATGLAARAQGTHRCV